MMELVDAGGDARVLSCDQQKDNQSFRPIGLRLRLIELDNGETTLGVEQDDSVRVSEPERESESQVVAALRLRGGHAITAVLLRESGVGKNTFYKAIKRLIERGQIRKSGQGAKTLYTLGDDPAAATAKSLPPQCEGSDTSPTATPAPPLKGAVAVSVGSVNLDHLSSEPLPDEPAVLPSQAPAADRGRRKRRPAAAAKSRAQHEAGG
jgi:transposase-like protein